MICAGWIRRHSVWSRTSRADKLHDCPACYNKAEKGVTQELDCFFSVGIFPVHSGPLTLESAAAAASVVKLPMLQSEGDKVKCLLEGQDQETAETSHDGGCARRSRGTYLLTGESSARLDQRHFWLVIWIA